MNDQQQAIIDGVKQGIAAAAPVAAVAVGVASVADPRVAAAMKAAALSMQLMNAATQLNDIQHMSDKELISLWASRGAAMVQAHNELFGDTMQVPTQETAAPKS